MKTRLIGIALGACVILSPALGHGEDAIKYTQCINTFKAKDGIQTGTIIKTMTGDVFETLESSFNFETDLTGPVCSILKKGRYNYILISGVGRKILAKRLN